MRPSPVKWLSDSQYTNLPIEQRAVAMADSQVGVRESGRNKGQQVEDYQQVAGLGRGGGYAWCACFVYWCLIQAGAKASMLPKRGDCAAVRNWVSWAKATNRLKATPKRGYLFYWLHDNGQGHIGFCISPIFKLIVRSIEGNTDGEIGSREGDGVYKRTRTVNELRRKYRHGFIDVSDL